MNLPALLDKFTALASRIETAFASAEATNVRISALTSERDSLASKLSALTTERDTLNASLAAITADLNQAKTDASAALTAKAAAEAAAAEAKTEADKLKANPSMQASAILAGVGHTPLVAGNGSSAPQAETPPANLSGTALAKWYHARGMGVTGQARR